MRTAVVCATVNAMNATCEALLPEIVARLKPLRPDRVILFGSNAGDSARDDSDIDLIVVLDTQEVPRTYDRKIELKLVIRESLREVNLRTPVDVLVYTKPEFDALVAQRSAFWREIERAGKVLYAQAGSSLA